MQLTQWDESYKMLLLQQVGVIKNTGERLRANVEVHI
jgi:hypothetical protein